MSDEDLTGQPWTREEVEATVADYFHMLRLTLLGQKVNKSAHRRALQKKLNGRSEGAIEMKHQNISAVMIELGAMPLAGYRGLPNYQDILIEAVSAQLEKDEILDRAAMEAVSRQAEPVLPRSFKDFVVPAPLAKVPGTRTKTAPAYARIATRRDYVERESRNRSLGLAGELLVLEYEAHRLFREGAKKLADRVEHVARTQGDGLGYDVLSFDADGKERFIEVKTTSFADTTPFFISHNEVRFSKEASDKFQLYRVFDFRTKPRLFQLQGAVDANCRLDPISFRASLL
ncbi:DUF3883 domain-containing protein [Arenimonas caeni]|jgi:hypothetical protein|uniref:DUF3883 domain-containing protein n=1 Tax=Arenimonas caeni TaxID=2058085 RepID=UPI002A36878E|nr:DUF3883 domain-containing protein [Arenimonas caeni]MDY0023053.1 DUF3883 domain-containing protein [Arenimonas caeni]